ncbi:MAG: HNH endonuclease [Hylemonella sp.]|jgi:5-methylcytosine-specific restriction protein A|nr:HNH endonuclease [Hylemonella sp.]
MTVLETLASLLPTQRLSVMDLVEQAGIDVTPWHTTAEGRPVKNPRANPSYCYDWAFGSKKEGFLVCIWHGSLKLLDFPSGQAIVYNENFRDLALGLDRKAIDRTQPSEERNRARSQAHRARAFDRALQLSFRRAMPVRVIVLEGDRRQREELGKASSTVDARKLDTENWFMHAYDNDTGNVLLVRGVVLASVELPAAEGDVDAPLKTPDQASPELDRSKYVDQFSVPAPPTMREATVLLRDRSAAVREAVLIRAGGLCELCNEPGFVTAAGSIYLETHHVVPLADSGPDHPSNVVAICPQDHRRAHYAAERDEIAIRLTAILDSKGATMAHQSYAT